MKASLSPHERLHGVNIPLLGLTGGIASGKSTVASLLEKKGIFVISADKLVKELYQQEATKNFIRQHFPGCMTGESIDFPLLRHQTFQDESIRTQLENFLHPRLPVLFHKTLADFSSPDFIVYDIPLLFEKSLQNQFDLVACVYAPKETQMKRLLSRDDIDESLAQAMLKGQTDIEIKKEKADAVIDNCATLQQLSVQVENFIQQYL